MSHREQRSAVPYRSDGKGGRTPPTEMFQTMHAHGMTAEQMTEMLLQSLREIGAEEIEGIWRMPEGK